MLKTSNVDRSAIIWEFSLTTYGDLRQIFQNRIHMIDGQSRVVLKALIKEDIPDDQEVPTPSLIRILLENAQNKSL